MVEVARSGTPGVIEIVEGLLAEVARSLFRNFNFEAEILIGNVFEPSFAAAPNVECNGPIAVTIRYAARLATVVLGRAENIRVEEQFNLIPLVRTQFALRAWAVTSD